MFLVVAVNLEFFLPLLFIPDLYFLLKLVSSTDRERIFYSSTGGMLYGLLLFSNVNLLFAKFMRDSTSWLLPSGISILSYQYMNERFFIPLQDNP